uniref:ER membrane protein SH3 n=1 Tax=Kwoniella pini CBS 10737 TaxID=1296096 RepID=A0A1B9I6P6_9TREE|nr:uncharacterized protein I206_03205 [Kwoniella pini CBS 10737]OCF51139.1 hypothetical protein I206_03205 [Kwoniella pini CBS 10737]
MPSPGTTFTHWIADHNVLWRSPITPEALVTSIKYYSYLSNAPHGMGWVYIAVGLVALASAGGRAVKGYKGQGGEVLFDGGAIVLWAAIAYTQIVDVYPTIKSIPTSLPNSISKDKSYPELVTAVRDLATNNIMTAVMLTGIMLLQAGRYYSKRADENDLPPSVDVSAASTPGRVPSPESDPAPPIKRSGTPFRELTEEEATELKG